jgi:hypothetical protein
MQVGTATVLPREGMEEALVAAGVEVLREAVAGRIESQM